jgi:hypothetical protein
MRVLSWYPLLCPQVLFKDRQGETNAFLETNPAVYIKSDGSFLALVRLVNYRKFHNRAFKMGGSLSESAYHLFTGQITAHGPSIQTSSPVRFDNTLPQYYSCWTGYEDIRFLDESRIICTSPTSSPDGKPVIVIGTLSDTATINIDTLCQPAQIEKNWMPFRVGSADFVLYSVCPLALKALHSPTPLTLHTAEELRGYHGSTNGIVWNAGFLFIVHSYNERSVHRWLYFDPVRRNYGFSEPFSFHSHSYIEFTCSLAVYNDVLYVGLGMNDDKAFLCSVETPDISVFKKYSF